MSNPTSDRIVLKMAEVIAVLKPYESLIIRYERGYDSAVCIITNESKPFVPPNGCVNRSHPCNCKYSCARMAPYEDKPAEGLPGGESIAWRVSQDRKHLVFEFLPEAHWGRDNAAVREWASQHGLKHGTEGTASKVFLSDGPDNSVSISPYPFEEDEYESFHLDVLDNFNPKSTTQGALRATLGNILRKANVNVTEE